MKKILSIFLLIALALGGTVKAETLGPLYDGTNSSGSYIPVEGNNVDRVQKVQVLYPKADLATLAGKNITKMTFYVKTKASKAWNAPMQIRLAEVDDAQFTSTSYLSGEWTTVYTGTGLKANVDEMEVVFETPFAYSGDKNLLFELQVTGTTGAYASAAFYAKGGYDPYYSIYKYATSGTSDAIATGTRKNVIPKTLFTYEEGAASTCAKPSALTKGEVTANTAAFTWTAGGTETSWQYLCLPAATTLTDEAWAGATSVTEASATATGLAANTSYKFYVRAYCSSEDQSAAISVAFTTEKSCYEPKNLGVSDKTIEGATISWAASGKGETTYQYTYAVWGQAANWDGAPTTTETTVTLSGLNSSTSYQVWVRSYCAAADQSEAITEYFTTLVDCSAKTLPLNEDFSNEDNIACWKMVDCNGSTGVSSGKFQFYYTTTPPMYLITPELIASEKQVKVEFDYWCYSGSYEESFQVGYSTTTNETDAFTWGDEYKTKNTSSSSPDEFSEIFPAGVKFICIKYTANNKYYLYIDNFSATEYEAPACPAISALEASEIGINSAKLSWTKGNEETAWKLQTSADGENWNEAVDVTENPYTLAGLTAKTKYYVRVAANCGSEVSEWSKAINFTTDCAAQDLLSESFGSTLPECWKVEATDANNWATSTTYKSSSRSMYYYASSSTENYADLITPLVNLGDKETQLTFYLKNDTYSGPVTAEVYIVVGTTTTKLVDLSSTSGWELQTIDLSTYTGQAAKFIFRAHGAGSYKYIYIDDVNIDVIPCALPTGLAAVQGNASATLTWTDENAEKWNLRYRIVKAEEPYNEWIEVKDITEKTKEISSLTNGSEYEAQVQAACSATRASEWTASVKFTPEDCPNVTSVSFGAQTYNSIVVNWATSSASNCDVRYKAGEGDWTTVSNIAETTKTLTGLTTGAVYTVQVKPSCGNADSWVAASETYTPVYSTPANTAVASITDNGASASWEAVADAPNGYQYIVVAKDATPEWASATATNELNVALANLEALVEYDFYVAAVYGANLGDAAKVSFKTVTVAPKNFTQVAISATSATYSWEKDGANTTFEYSLDGEAWTAVATNQVVLNGLTGNTAYTLYVRSVYAGELRSANASVTFRTECAAVSALAWTKGNFEDETGLEAPRCWTVYTPNEYPYVNTWYPHAGSYHLWFQNGGSAGKEQIAALPEFTEDIKTLKMSFYYHNSSYTSSSYPSLEVGVMSDLNDSASFRALVVLDKISKYGTQPTEVLFSKATASEKYIAFRYAGGTYDGRATIDDITFSAAPTCFAPEITSTTILPDGASFAWAAGNGETNFQYAIDTTETLVWKATDATEATIHGLVPGNNYNFYVRAFCDPEVSDSVWTAFKPVCPAPTAPAVSAVTTTTATLSWTAAAGINDYQYVVLAKGAAEDWTGAVKVEGANTASLTSLAASTEYTVYVRSYFSETIQSAATSVDFATECAAISALPWTEDFSDKATGSLPLCWNAEGATSSVTIASSGYAAFDGNGLYFSGSTDYAYVLLPEFEAAFNTLQISFKHNEEDPTKSGQIEFGYYKEGAFTQLKVCDKTAAKTWVNEGPIALTEVPAGARIAFAYKAATNMYTAVIDNIKVEVIPSCAVPTALAASDITDATAKLTWTSEADAFKVQYTADKADWGAELDAATASYAIEGLNPNTLYYARVKAVCGTENESEWTEEISFTTECAAVDDLNEDFAAGIPECWKTSGTWSTDTWTYGSTAPGLKYSATAAGEITTVAVNVTKEEAVLQFNIQNSYSNGYSTAYRTGRVIIKAADVEDFSTDFINSNDIKNLQTIDLAAYYGKTITITFQVNALSSAKAVYFDDVKIIVKPCDTPKNLKATASLDSVVLAWEQGGDETTYQYSVVKKGAAADWKNLEAGVRTVTVKGLATDTLYTASVRSYCGAGREGETILTADFMPLCPQPSAIVITDITAYGAKASWTAAAGIAKYQWSLVEDEWLEANIVEATSIDLSELNPASAYTLYVRSYYNATSVSAAISQAFNTDCAVLPMPFVEDFTGLSAGIPQCWDNEAGTSANNWAYYAEGRIDPCVRFNSYTTDADVTNILKTPSIAIAADSKEPELAFYFKNPAGGAFAVMVYNVTADDTTALELGELTGVEDWTLKTASLAAFKAQEIQVWFHATSNGGPVAFADAYIYLDDVNVAEHNDIPLAIENLGAGIKSDAIKYMENGVLYIIRDGIKYNAQGAQVSK